jgi:hypothetical protein
MRHRFWIGIGLASAVAAYLTFALVLPLAVWPPATLMTAIALLIIGVAYGIAVVGARYAVVYYAGCLALCLLAARFAYANRPFIDQLTRDSRGREVIETLAPLAQSDDLRSPRTVAIPWGTEFFAAAYGLYVTRELSGFTLVDHRANFQQIVQEEGRILTLPHYLVQWNLAWWQGQLGQAFFDLIAPHVTVISPTDLYNDVPHRLDFNLGNGVRVRAVEMRWSATDQLRASVYWESVVSGDADYSVAVHLIAHEPPRDAGDIIQQADSVHPVAGQYPVSLWRAGEVIRDDFLLSVPAGKTPIALRVAMYSRGDQGQFINTDWLSLPLSRPK